MKKHLLFLFCTFLSIQAFTQDTTLIKSADLELTTDEKINQQVAPFTTMVEEIVFYSINVKKELVINEILAEGNARFTKTAPYDITYDDESNVPLNKPFTIEYINDEQYQLRHRFSENGNDYLVVNHYNFGEQVELDGFRFTVEKTKVDPITRQFRFRISTISVPFVLIWLMLGALIFTIYFGFINFRRFKLSIDIVRGKYTDPTEKGEVSHFQALTAALSATVGLGNIAGVAIAISLGGPGATFWMIIAGLLGMSSKFVECTLGVKYRQMDKNGVVYGGPMYYLRDGLKKRGWGVLGKILAVFFAVMCIGGSLGGGNMFQVNQAFKQFTNVFETSTMLDQGFVFGLLMAVFVGIVIIGGIKSIARVTEKIVPFMVGIYVIAALIIIITHIEQVPNSFALIFNGAFSSDAVAGGFIGVLIQGFRRAAFSNEAGIGSASIAHSAVKTNNPASEGLVALLEPFIDTVIVCTMTALVIVITEGYVNVDLSDGITITSTSFASVISWFPYILAIAVILFAFSTMISWSYYGLQSWKFIFGKSRISDISFKVLFCVFVVIGAAMDLAPVIGFSDAMIFAMCFPNVFGLYFLMPEVKAEVNEYLRKIKSGEIIRQ